MTYGTAEEECVIDDPRGDLEWRIENKAEWRRRKAAQYPEDVRNAAAANSLMALMGTDLSPEAERRYAKIGGAIICSDEGGADPISEALTDVGFRFFPKTLNDLVAGIPDA